MKNSVLLTLFIGFSGLSNAQASASLTCHQILSHEALSKVHYLTDVKGESVISVEELKQDVRELMKAEKGLRAESHQPWSAEALKQGDVIRKFQSKILSFNKPEQTLGLYEDLIKSISHLTPLEWKTAIKQSTPLLVENFSVLDATGQLSLQQVVQVIDRSLERFENFDDKDLSQLLISLKAEVTNLQNGRDLNGDAIKNKTPAYVPNYTIKRTVIGPAAQQLFESLLSPEIQVDSKASMKILRRNDNSFVLKVVRYKGENFQNDQFAAQILADAAAARKFYLPDLGQEFDMNAAFNRTMGPRYKSQLPRVGNSYYEYLLKTEDQDTNFVYLKLSINEYRFHRFSVVLPTKIAKTPDVYVSVNNTMVVDAPPTLYGDFKKLLSVLFER